MTSSTKMPGLLRRLARDNELPGESGNRQSSESRNASPLLGTRKIWITLRFIAVIACAIASRAAVSQSLSNAGDPSANAASVSAVTLATVYSRPTQKTKFDSYLFEAYGPYPIVGAGVAAGINQLGNAPPEWHEGAEGFGKRFVSDLAIAAVSTTTRYGLSKPLKEDALYYRCDCRGLFPRMEHALVSTFTARSGADGHRVFSIPALVAPYAGTFTAVYGWYPNRYGAKDAFRMGNYNLLGYMAGNLSLEFFYSGPRSLFSRLHLNNAHGSPVEGPNK